MEQKFIKPIEINNFELYSNGVAYSDIGGVHDKVFARIDSNSVYPLIHAIRSDSNCSYVTYANDLIKSGETPRKLSTMVKYSRELDIDMMVNEVIGSRLLNLFGVPTVYNECFVCDDTYLTCSVDFMKNNENIQTVAEILNIDIPSFNLAETIEQSKRAFDYVWHHTLNNSDENYAESLDEFIYRILEMYFFKVLLLRDSDFAIHNIGVIVDPDTKTISVAPAHDFEYSFNACDEISCFIQYCLEQYPDKLQDLIIKMNRVDRDQIFQVIDDVDEFPGGYLHNIMSSINRINMTYSIYSQEYTHKKGGM